MNYIEQLFRQSTIGQVVTPRSFEFQAAPALGARADEVDEGIHTGAFANASEFLPPGFLIQQSQNKRKKLGEKLPQRLVQLLHSSTP